MAAQARLAEGKQFGKIVLTPAMRWRAVLECAVLILAAAGPAVADDEALWTLLRAGGQVIMLRHAGTIGTVGNPPGFHVEDCSTQRNLTEAGREHPCRQSPCRSRTTTPPSRPATRQGSCRPPAVPLVSIFP